ncbi:MAG: phage holin family protein [Prevotellaceae bacterium]|jgi:putative membrane protein|nr:phage holin family protein [Prevotellaceae bacterium]
MNYIIRILITAAVAYILPQFNFVEGVEFADFKVALAFALLLSVLNLIVKPIISLFALPITILTLGLFALIINVLMIYITNHFIAGMNIEGFVNVLVFSTLLSIFTSVLTWIFKNKK